MREKIFVSDTIQISEEDVSPRSFFQPEEALLFLDSYTFANVYITNALEQITRVRNILA